MAKQRRLIGLMVSLALLLRGLEPLFFWLPKGWARQEPQQPQQPQQPQPQPQPQHSEPKWVSLVGPSGVGKLTTINELMGLRPATSADEELKPDHGPRVSSAFESCTSRVLSKGPANVTFDFNQTKWEMCLNVSDTPGIPDTNGRGVSFLDAFMKHAKENPLNGVVLMIDASSRLTQELQYALLALRECFNGLLSETRLILYINKLPNSFSLKQQGIRRNEEQAYEREKKATEVAHFVANILFGPGKAGEFRNYVKNEQGSDDGVEGLKFLISQLPAARMDSSQFRTWTEKKKYYEDLKNGVLDREQCMQELRKRKEGRKEEIKQSLPATFKEFHKLDWWWGKRSNQFLHFIGAQEDSFETKKVAAREQDLRVDARTTERRYRDSRAKGKPGWSYQRGEAEVPKALEGVHRVGESDRSNT